MTTLPPGSAARMLGMRKADQYTTAPTHRAPKVTWKKREQPVEAPHVEAAPGVMVNQAVATNLGADGSGRSPVRGGYSTGSTTTAVP